MKRDDEKKGKRQKQSRLDKWNILFSMRGKLIALKKTRELVL